MGVTVLVLLAVSVADGLDVGVMLAEVVGVMVIVGEGGTVILLTKTSLSVPAPP